MTLQEKEASIEALGPEWSRFLLLFRKGRALHISAIEEGSDHEKQKAQLRAAEEARYRNLVDLLLTVATDSQASNETLQNSSQASN